MSGADAAARRPFALVLTGPPGAGKSSVLTALHDALGDAGVANALIEVDELERCYPPLPADRVFAHVAALARSYRDAGHDLLLVTATLEDAAYRDALLGALAPAERLVVRLEAAADTLERRVREREPAGWGGLEELVASARTLAVEMTRLPGVDRVLSTEGERAEDVADRLEALLPERFRRR